MVAAQAREVPAVDGAGLAGLERRDSCGAWMRLADERQLPEGLARAEDRQEGGVAQSRSQARGEPAARDEVERVGGIALVEHDLPARKGAPPGDRQHRLHFRFRHVREQVPAHGCEDTPARSAARGGSALQPGVSYARDDAGRSGRLPGAAARLREPVVDAGRRFGAAARRGRDAFRRMAAASSSASSCSTCLTRRGGRT